MGDDGFVRLAADVAGSGSQATKSLTYYDGFSGLPICGRSYASPTAGAAFGVAVVYVQAPEGGCGSTVGDGSDVAATAVHELIHDLGAVSASAPHHCQNGHVCENRGDILYPTASYGVPLGSYVLDFNDDDYYAHSGAWWDVQDSPWLIHVPQRPLKITLADRGGTGEVVISAGVSCPKRCDVAYDDGASVDLTAVAGDGSRFVGWEGDCIGAGVCTFTADGPKRVTATFGPASYVLTVTVAGRGIVKSVPAGIRCSRRCGHAFEAETKVRLTATPRPGYRFSGWKRDCRGARACVLRLDRPATVEAVFKRR
jgi:hypothetical protein